ncbi:ABC transporter permease [Lentisphaerota bacterium ZTH]|nr:ABC transporter permease [Lentisphaerota bacterium]WET05235.1 ABC transporter permease [Lentisphaerota bacterium ZTH]
MRTFHSFSMAFTALRRNPMRGALTALGIIIGVSSVITMMEVGNGSSQSIQQSISSMGANVLLIIPGEQNSSGISFGSGTAKTLTPGDCEAINRECSAVRAAAPIVKARAQVVWGSRNWVPMAIAGTTLDYLTITDRENLMRGQPFTNRDVLNGNRVCIIGKTVAEKLFEDENPVGKDIRIKNVSFKIVGELAPKGANMIGMDQDDIVLAPWTTVNARVSGESLSEPNQSTDSTTDTNTLSNLYPSTGPELYPPQVDAAGNSTNMQVRYATIDQIMVSAVSAEAIPTAIDQITSLLKDRHRITPGKENDFGIRDMTEMTKLLTSATSVMTNLLLCVAMISLLVGGVGIMNIMLVSVTERTREIGLRMAVGAKSRDILLQFLTESLVLCMLGGIIGIILGHSGAMLIAHMLKWPTAASPMVIIVAISVSVGIGVIFGYYPAWKASKLNPIEALRYE